MPKILIVLVLLFLGYVVGTKYPQLIPLPI